MFTQSTSASLEKTQEYNEDELFFRLKQGDEQAFTEIYHLYWERLFFMAHKRLQSGEDAKEIVQDVFLTLWQKRDGLRIHSLPLYLGAMGRYAVYRHLAVAKRREAQLSSLHTRPESREITAFDLDNKQFLDILARLANDLPEKYRVVFVNHKLLDQPLEDVARQLGISPRTAEDYVTKVMRIMRKYRERLGGFFWFL